MELNESIGFIPMDLEEELMNAAKWGGTTINGIIGILSAMIDAGLTDEDLLTAPAKTGSQYEKFLAKKTKEIWDKIEPYYKGDFKGNKFYSPISHFIDNSSRRMYADGNGILKRFKPFRKYQKDEYLAEHPKDEYLAESRVKSSTNGMIRVVEKYKNLH